MLKLIPVFATLLFALPALAETGEHMHTGNPASHRIEGSRAERAAITAGAPQEVDRKTELEAIMTLCKQRDRVAEMTKDSNFTSRAFAGLPTQSACDDAKGELAHLQRIAAATSATDSGAQPEVAPEAPAAPVQ